jgi:hypothetical protein
MHSPKSDFRKSSYSAGNGACVEVGTGITDKNIIVRDSKNLSNGPLLQYSIGSWRSFLREMKNSKLH